MKKAVVICLPNAFKFGWLGSTSRLFSITNAFNKLDYEVILIAQRYENAALQKSIETDYPGKIIRSDFFDNYPFYIGKYKIVRKLTRGIWKLFGSNYILFKLSLSWSKSLDIIKLIAKHDLKNSNIQLIWGISGGLLDGLNLADKLSNELKVPWVMELHDPPIGADIKCEFSNIVNEFSRLIQSSDMIVPTSDTYKSLLINKYVIEAEKCITMFLTYKEDISFIESKATRNNDWNICYAGSLKGPRNLSTFIMGLAAAISVKPKIKDCVKIKLAGIGEGFDDALRLAREYQLESCFNFKGLLTGLQANNLMANCDTLLIVQPSDNDLEIPGKIFQMMSFKKSIIGLMDPKSETASIINKSGLGYVSPISDVQDIQGVILQLYEKHLEGSFNLPNDNFIESFSESKLSNSLSKVLSNLITAP